MTDKKYKEQLGQKIRSLREGLNWTQHMLAEKMGWASHTIVGNVESGSRDIKAFELATLSQLFRTPLNAFFNAEQELGNQEQYILWREMPQDNFEEHKSKFFEVCNRYTYLEQAISLSQNKIKRNLPSFELDLSSTTYSEIYDLAEQTRKELDLGSLPANDLIRSLEEDYEIKIVYLNLLDKEGSAACSVIGESKFIMLNSNEVPWRRNFSLAHELFHLITWNTELFKQIAEDEELWSRNEKLADAFAAGLLMPQEQTRHLISKYSNEEGAISYSDLIAMSRDFQVSTVSLLWRLVGLRIIGRATVKELLSDSNFKDLELELNRQRIKKDHYRSWKFVRMAYLAHTKGRLSKTKLANFLEVPLVDVDEELAEFGLAIADEQKISLSNT